MWMHECKCFCTENKTRRKRCACSWNSVFCDLRAFEIGGPIRIVLLIRDNSNDMEMEEVSVWESEIDASIRYDLATMMIDDIQNKSKWQQQRREKSIFDVKHRRDSVALIVAARSHECRSAAVCTWLFFFFSIFALILKDGLMWILQFIWISSLTQNNGQKPCEAMKVNRLHECIVEFLVKPTLNLPNFPWTCWWRMSPDLMNLQYSHRRMVVAQMSSFFQLKVAISSLNQTVFVEKNKWSPLK